jgi:hypothetical protein
VGSVADDHQAVTRARAQALWREADVLRRRANARRMEANSLAREAERLNALAAAVADGRDENEHLRDR